MEIRRVDEQSIALLEIDVFLSELLRQIPITADPTGNPAAEERLYPSPTAGAHPEMDGEWKDYVVPDLKEKFQSAIEIVSDDLADFPGDGDDDFSLVLQANHMDAWIHTLNQARLALACRYDIKEEDMERMPVSGDERALALFQIHFYGYLQERFLAELDQ